MATVSAFTTMGSSAEGSSSVGSAGKNIVENDDWSQWFELFTHTLETSAMLATMYVAVTHQKEIGDAANLVVSRVGEAKQFVEDPSGFVQGHASDWVKGSVTEKAKALGEVALSTPGVHQAVDGFNGVLGFASGFFGNSRLPDNFKFTFAEDGKSWTLEDTNTGYAVKTSSEIPAWLQDMEQVQEEIEQLANEFSPSDNPTSKVLHDSKSQAVEGDTWDDSWENFKDYLETLRQAA